jgi:hypothetical protein
MQHGGEQCNKRAELARRGRKHRPPEDRRRGLRTADKLLAIVRMGHDGLERRPSAG